MDTSRRMEPQPPLGAKTQLLDKKHGFARFHWYIPEQGKLIDQHMDVEIPSDLRDKKHLIGTKGASGWIWAWIE